MNYFWDTPNPAPLSPVPYLSLNMNVNVVESLASTTRVGAIPVLLSPQVGKVTSSATRTALIPRLEYYGSTHVATHVLCCLRTAVATRGGLF